MRSLRRHYPDQVRRVCGSRPHSQRVRAPLATIQGSTVGEARLRLPRTGAARYCFTASPYHPVALA